MKLWNTRKHTAISAFMAGAMVGLCAAAALAAVQYIVSQKGREFTPKEITVTRGEAITVANDDADLRHHAYINSKKYNFDSGDQEPGSKTRIPFPVAGTFEVLCAIHPKMKLTVHVK